jgi:hypothetical protein
MLLQIIFIDAAVAEFYSKLCLGHQFGLAQPLMAFRISQPILVGFGGFLACEPMHIVYMGHCRLFVHLPAD